MTHAGRWLSLVLTVAVVAGPSWADPPRKVLLLYQGPDGHPPKTHEYEKGMKLLQALLRKVPELETTLVNADEPWKDGPGLLAKADGAVLFLSEGAAWLWRDKARLEAFQDLARRKGGLVVLHWAMGTKEAAPIKPFVELFGGCHGGPDRKYKVLATEALIVDRMHPLCRGLRDFKVRDEFYYQLKLYPSSAQLLPLVQVEIDGKLETVAWAWERPDGGRSFGFSGLHFDENWQLPEYRRLVAQAVLWTNRVAVPKGGLPIVLGGTTK
jgi:type 1 glutamine amidotransferase